MNILEVRNLTHIFPNGTVAIDDINLSIREGDFLIISGANGSGKTVLIRHFNGLLLPTKGEVLLEGRPITDNLTETRKKIGLIFQNSDTQIVGQTVLEDISFGPENLNLPRSEVEHLAKQALKAVSLENYAHHQPYTLSGGLKRKLAIAGVLAMKPRIIVFDEPFAGLDYPGTVQVLTQILLLQKAGHTIVVVTHELEKILAHANRLVIMMQGRIVMDDQPANLVDELARYDIKKPFGENRKIETMTWLS